jgi:alpha-galactosidase
MALCLTDYLRQNNWNALGCDVSKCLLLDTSKRLVDSGLRDIGYKYVVLDDCWSDRRGEDKHLIVDKEKFPNSIKAVVDAIYKRGFLYGMYSSTGEMTCARYGQALSIFDINIG